MVKMTEYWRRALDNNLVVKEDSVDFGFLNWVRISVDFWIGFDQVSHQVSKKYYKPLALVL